MTGEVNLRCSGCHGASSRIVNPTKLLDFAFATQAGRNSKTNARSWQTASTDLVYTPEVFDMNGRTVLLYLSGEKRTISETFRN